MQKKNRTCVLLSVVVSIFFIASSFVLAADKVVVIPLSSGKNTVAGQSCSPGGYITGFDTKGDIICHYPVKFVFVTQGEYSTGVTLVEVSGADAICQAEAEAALLPGIYKAWISDSVSDPATSFNKSNDYYILPGGELVAHGWINLTDGSLDHAINQHADGTGCTSGGVWTGTSANGIKLTESGANCNDWTGGAGHTGTAGSYNRIDSGWSTYYNDYDCVVSSRLYCFQQL